MLKNFNEIITRNRVLVAPLDWGLGHATRCIPIIKNLLECKCEVIIAAEGTVQTLLQNEFPDLQFLPLKGYRIKYGRSRYLTFLTIFLQIPSIILTIFREKRWLKRIILTHRIDAVISDNRFGLYSKKVPCIYITHQLRIKTGNVFIENFIQKIHKWIINKFTICWVPDFSISENIAGELSHPKKIPENVSYIGCLSRFEKKDTEKKYDVLIVLSGPEPQRTLFEKILLEQINEIEKTVLFVRGLPNETSQLMSANTKLTFVNHLTADRLNEAILQSKIVISRSGYTTIMDLIKLEQKAILIPTPGQTEQEYLAAYLSEKKIFLSASQHKFSLKKLLIESDDFPYLLPKMEMDLYKTFIRNFVNTIKSN